MRKSELVARVADKVHLSRWQTEAIVSIFLRCITDALREGDRVELRGFGSFQTRGRNARQGRNPKTGDAVHVTAKQVPFFRVAKELRERVTPPGNH